jgi:hypothetical protein
MKTTVASDSRLNVTTQQRLAERLALLAACAAMMACTAPSASRDPEERTGQTSSALILPNFVNIPVGFTKNHETSATFVRGAGAPESGPVPGGRWVAATINVDGVEGVDENIGLNRLWSWMYSADGNASSWTFRNQQAPLEFGCPGGNGGIGNCPGSPSPTNGSSFKGWRGDPSVAAVTNPDWSRGDKRVVGVNVANTTAVQGSGSDAIIALSEDGGESWENLQWLNDAASGVTDMPFVFSSPETPWSTYASWESGDGRGYLRKIEYGVAPATFNQQNPVIGPIPKKAGQENDQTARINFGLTKLPLPCTSGGEGIVVVYTNYNSGNRCGRNTYNPTLQIPIYWNIAIYDTVNGQWWGPYELAADNLYKGCVGAPPTQAYTNVPDPHVAVDPVTAHVWVSHTRQFSLTGPVRAVLEWGQLACGGQPGDPLFRLLGSWTAPDPNGFQGADNWAPAVAMHRQGANQRVGVYWYSTVDVDNSRASLLATYQENLGAFQFPLQLTKPNYPVGGTTDWAVGGQDPWDYQTLAASKTNGSFLALWAGDRRSTSVPSWNGGFETGSFGSVPPKADDWQATGVATAITTADAHSGGYSALLGSAVPPSCTWPCGENGNSKLRQDFQAPPGAKRVSFWYKMYCPDYVQWDWLVATLKDNDTNPPTTVDILPNTCTETFPPVIPQWTLSPTQPVIPGHHYTLTITNHDDGYAGDAAYSYIDDIVFGGDIETTIMTNVAH